MPTRYQNARVFTGDGVLDGGFVTDGVCFAAVGSDEQLRRLYSDAPAVDLGGRFVCPGFNDSHMHLLELGCVLTQAQLAPCTDALTHVLAAVGAFAKAHPAAAKRAFVINLDCVSDGRTLLYAGSKEAMKCAKARSVAEALTEVAPRYDREGKTGTSPGTFYPSDQLVFRRGTAFAALRGRHVLYLSRIHTPRDKQFDERNLLCLLEVLTKALRQEVQ